MHGFIKRFADGIFYPEEVQILTAAFDDAWGQVFKPAKHHSPPRIMLWPLGKFSPSTSSRRLSEGSVIAAG
jgi:hypothetical protein